MIICHNTRAANIRKSLLSMVLLGLASCGGSDGPVSALPEDPLVPQQSLLPRETLLSPSATGDESVTAADSVSRFGLTLFGEWLSQPENADSNLIFSPLSLYSALLMAQAGAENETLRQMSDVLQLTVPRQEANTNFNALDLALEGRGVLPGDGVLQMVNGLFLDRRQTVQQPFLDTLASQFGVGVFPIETNTADAAEVSRVAVNAWFKDQTAGKFPDFLPPGVLQDARLVLSNAVTFQGAWKQPFDANLTREGNFLLSTGVQQPAQFMEQSGVLAIKHEATYDAINLPFAGGDFALQIVMPQSGKIQSIEDAVRANPQFNFLDGATPTFVRVAMPKFEFATILPAEAILMRLGIVDAFDAATADFSGIDGTKDLKISRVIHKAALKVDEKGAAAEAGSAVIVGPPSGPTETFTIDRPFFFAIRDVATGLVTFVGRVMNPVL